MKIKDIVTFVSKSITPKQGVTYNLYSLPSFDEGKTSEILDGTEIQSNKYDVQIIRNYLVDSKSLRLYRWLPDCIFFHFQHLMASFRDAPLLSAKKSRTYWLYSNCGQISTGCSSVL